MSKNVTSSVSESVAEKLFYGTLVVLLFVVFFVGITWVTMQCFNYLPLPVDLTYPQALALLILRSILLPTNLGANK